jgi:hypothetical protein
MNFLPTDRELRYQKEELLNYIEKHVLSYHVSLGSYLGYSELPTPTGSGTFVKFSISSHSIYGILSAAHVVKDLKFGLKGGPSYIGLSKLQKGDTVACIAPFPYIYGIASIQGFQSNSRDAYKPDIAFIALGIDEHLPKHDLITLSSFYDLDGHIDLITHDSQIASAFYRGAAPKRPDGLLDTAVHIGGGELIKYDDEAMLHYWQVPNELHKSISGGSGAGFWRFDCNQQIIVPSLEGVVISEESISYSYFEALSPSYLYDEFLPKLKHVCSENLSWFSRISSN